MRLFIGSKTGVVVLMSVAALIGALVIGPATLAQRPDTEVTRTERSGPDVAPAMRDFGDFSVAFRNLARKAFPSIVSIDAISRPTQRCEGSAWQHEVGSGFVIDPKGLILTSSQLVSGADRVKVRLRDGSEFLASSVRMDPRSDVAVVEISPVANLQALPLGDSDAMQVGDWVLAVGRSSQLTPTAQAGIINGFVPGPCMARGEDFFQTDAAVNVGGGGGPILNLNGQVVGITTSDSNWNEESGRMGMAVPSNLVKWSSRQLIDNGVVSRGFLGVQTQPLNHRLARQFNVPLVEGALVNRVNPNSPAAEATIQPGDVITKLDGKAIIDSRRLQTVAEHLEPGRTYPVEIIRNGGKINLNVKAAQMPEQMNLPPRRRRIDAAANVTTRVSTFADLGLTVREATPEAIRQAGYQDPVHGVIIDSIQPNSSAAAAGLQKGMVIERVGQTDLKSLADFSATEPGIATNNGAVLYVHTPQGPRFVSVGPDES